jgi:hypothetical protein
VVAMDLLDDESLIDLRRRAKATDPAAVLEEERRRRAATPSAKGPVDGTPATPLGAPAATPSAAASASAQGLCALCLTRPSRGTCAMCGRGACAADLWVMLRLCRSCASERDMERSQRPARPEASNWLGPGPGGRA